MLDNRDLLLFGAAGNAITKNRHFDEHNSGFTLSRQ
jgi:hypothetical protein